MVHGLNVGRKYISLIRTCKERSDNDNNREEEALIIIRISLCQCRIKSSFA